MRDYVDLYKLLESDGDFMALVESRGLKPTSAHLHLQVRSLRSTRGFRLATDIEERDYDARVLESFITLTGEAVMEGDPWRMDRMDRLCVWDGTEGAFLMTQVSVSLYDKPDKPYSPLSQTARLRFNSDPPLPLAPRWELAIPLPEAELEALCHAVEGGTAYEIRISVTVHDLFKQKRDFDYLEGVQTASVALPHSLVTKQEMPDARATPDVRDMPCSEVSVYVRSGTFRSEEVAKREKETRDADEPWEPEPVPLPQQQLSAVRGVRDALRLIAVALLLIFMALLF